MTFETVGIDTPAARAMSAIVAARSSSPAPSNPLTPCSLPRREYGPPRRRVLDATRWKPYRPTDESFQKAKVASVGRLLLIGAGTIARHHAGAALACTRAASIELHVADVSDDALRSFGEQFPRARRYRS